MKTNIMELAKELIKNGEDFVVAKVVDAKGSTPRKKGAWLLMRKNDKSFGTVGGGILETETEKMALALFESKQSYIHHFVLTPGKMQSLDMRCGGDVDISFEYISADNAEAFLEEFRIKSTAYIFGAGHVGLALEPILRYVGFDTIVVDDREEFVNRERFPESKNIFKISNYQNAFSQLHPDKNSYIVIVTRGHAGDYEVLKQSLEFECAYIGMIGSRKKVAYTFDLLEKQGVSRERLEKVHSPIGIDIKAETPEEIAISITAEMISVRALAEENDERN
ncbi:MAG: XdhC family protein [Aminipila sp.]